MRVQGAVVVVTGAAGGIGRATALRLARSGAHVVLAGRRAAALETVAEECRAHGVRAVAVPTDVTDAAAVDRLARRAVDDLGRIDVWVNSASVGVFGTLADSPVEDVRRLLDVNVMGYVHGARAALTQMRRQGTGVLVNVSSVIGVVPTPYSFAYAMAKAAVRALSVSLRSELRLAGLDGIHVVTVVPATVDTPFFQQAANVTGHEVRPIPPVYSPRRAARVIVRAVRRPRREVPVGPTARAMLVQHRLAPGLTERVMADHVHRTLLDRSATVPPTEGNLYRPSAEPRDTAATGGWGGARRTAQRRLLTAAILAGGGLLARRARR